MLQRQTDKHCSAYISNKKSGTSNTGLTNATLSPILLHGAPTFSTIAALYIVIGPSNGSVRLSILLMWLSKDLSSLWY